jgi:hypothetical protein
MQSQAASNPALDSFATLIIIMIIIIISEETNVLGPNNMKKFQGHFIVNELM